MTRRPSENVSTASSITQLASHTDTTYNALVTQLQPLLPGAICGWVEWEKRGISLQSCPLSFFQLMVSFPSTRMSARKRLQSLQDFLISI